METKTTQVPIGSTFYVVGMLAGFAIQLNWLAQMKAPQHTPRALLLLQVIGGAAIFTALLGLLRRGFHWMLDHSILPQQVKERYSHYDGWAYTPLLLFFLGAFGLDFSWQILLLITLLFIGAQVLLIHFLKYETRQQALGSTEWLGFLFLLSGFAALMYQIIWQRVLFTIYGVNIESVTVIVSIFMFGLGLGSLLGGVLSKSAPKRLPMMFFLFELTIGAFGVISIPLIKYVGHYTQQLSLFQISLVTFGLLCLPTMLMGATLPILVAHINQKYHHVGKSVGLLYFFNTLGSALACFLTVELFFSLMGQQMTTVLAATFNFATGFLVFQYMTQPRLETAKAQSTTTLASPTSQETQPPQTPSASASSAPTKRQHETRKVTHTTPPKKKKKKRKKR